MNVSVIIPLYNKQDDIQNCLQSIEKQTTLPDEIIIINDGSTDKSLEKVMGFKSKTNLNIRIYSHNNVGPAASRNCGIKISKNDFIAFLDADDMWGKYYLKTIQRLINKFPNAGIYATAYKFLLPGGRLRKANLQGISTKHQDVLIDNYYRAALLGDPPLWTSAVVVKKKVFYEVGFFYENDVMGEDLELWLRIAHQFPIAFSWYLGAVYNKKLSNRVTNKNIAPLERKLFSTGNQLLLHEDLQDEFKFYLREYLNKHYLLSARDYILIGDSKKAKEALKKICTIYHIKRKYWLFFLSLLPNNLLKILWNMKHKGSGLYRSFGQ